MEREAFASLQAWAGSSHRKPLVVRGARQVGKTWLVNEFGQKTFAAVAHVVFLNNEIMQGLFAGSLEPARLLTAIGAYTNTNPLDGNTLVFLDEIQECPRAIASLKMLCEQMPQIPVIAAGSLLGVALNRQKAEDGGRISWPVGKVDYLDLHPMTFREFLRALGEDQLADLIRPDSLDIISALGEKYEDLLRIYLFTGGMPEAVQKYVDTRLLAEVRHIQSNLLRDFEYDFSKHVDSPLETEHIRELWRSIPTQISRETGSKKFVYSKVRQGGRGRDYKDAISWLVDAGLILRVNKVSKPGIPLKTYEDEQSFKLFMLDVGLLGAALGLDEQTVLNGNRLFTLGKGVYAEQFVCEQLCAVGSIPRYWAADGKQSKGEVDFLYESEGQVVPVEVKANDNVKSRSIANFSKTYGIDRCLRLSLRGYIDQGWLVNIPLYAANILPLAL